jgi:hypothetical protein
MFAADQQVAIRFVLLHAGHERFTQRYTALSSVRKRLALGF